MFCAQLPGSRQRPLLLLVAALALWPLAACVGLQAPLSPSEQPEDDAFAGQSDEQGTGDDESTEPEPSDEPDGPDEPLEEDAATLLSFDLPATMECGELLTASVLMGNSGSATWTREGGYKLGILGDEAPLYNSSDTRVWLDSDDEVLPGYSHLFSVELLAPQEPGLHVTDWQMVREGVHWFGDVGTQVIEVQCASAPAPTPIPGPPPAPPDLGTVTWLHSDVSAWPETATLSPVTISGSSICLDYDRANQWPVYNIGVAVVANPWIFIWENGQWYGATWEWLRPGQICKAVSSVAGTHIKRSPFGEHSGWLPTSGQTYWFMVSGLARFSERNVEERSNLVPFVWP
jgi:hypothetical protein